MVGWIVGGERNLKRWQSIILVTICALAINQGATQAAEFLILPASADGPHTITGNQIHLEGGGQRVFFDIFVAKWDSDLDGFPKLKGLQITVDSESFNSGIGASLTTTEIPCVDNTLCSSLLSPSSFCFTKSLEPLVEICAPGYIESIRSDYLFLSVPVLPAVDLSSSSIRYGITSLGESVTDPGVPRYLGTLVLDVPLDARGNYSISLVDELIIQEDNTLIEPIELIQATIAMACSSNAECDDGNPCTFDNCLNRACFYGDFDDIACDDGNPCTENDLCFNSLCTGQRVMCATELTCDPVDGLCKFCLSPADCDDQNACTDDFCINGDDCFSEPNFDNTTSCCDVDSGLTCVASTVGMAGDADDNGAVDLWDYAVYQRCFGVFVSSPVCAAVDLDCNCHVDFSDQVEINASVTGP